MSEDLPSLVGRHALGAVVEDGRITAIGAGWVARLGRDPTGDPAGALAAPDSAGALAAAIAGGVGDVDVGAARLRVTGLARPGGAVLVGTDVTDLRERDRAARRAEAVLREAGSTLARARHRLAEAHALAGIGSFELDPRTHQMTWSPGMYALSGVPADTDLGEPTAFSHMVHPDDLDRVHSWFWSSPAEGEAREIEFRFVRHDGVLRHARSVMTTDHTGDGRPLVCGTVMDVTAAAAAAAELARARDEATQAMRAHSQFLAALSHELRTPVAGVIGLIDLAVAGREPLTAQRDLRSAAAAARHLLEVIEDLLDYARLEAGQLTLEARDFDLADVIAESVAVVAATARDKGLAVDAWISPDLARWRKGDPLRVRQILVNLLGNAVKFTEKGGVAVTVAPGAAPGEISLKVDDTGVGIAPDRLGAVFEPFVQGEAGKRFGGSGLGLAIARELTARMNGRIDVASTPGAGSHFTLTLRLPVGTPQAPALAPPRRRAAATTPPNPPPLAPTHAVAPSRRLRVLVADDTALVRDVVARVLVDSGHDAVPVGDGDAAVAAVLAGRFDLVLMDLSMPGTDGLAATRRIRVEERARDLPRVPIVALTAWPDDQQPALAAGMDDYLVKPVDHARLAGLCAAIADHEIAPPIDRAALLDRVGNQPKLAADIAALFVAQQARLCVAVRDAVMRGDAEEIARQAHGLKGALVMVAATPAGKAAAALEAAAADPGARVALLTRLEREVARAVAALALEAA